MLTPTRIVARSLIGLALLSALVGHAQTLTTSNLAQSRVDPDYVFRRNGFFGEEIFSYGSAFTTGNLSSTLASISIALAAGSSGSGFTVTVNQFAPGGPGAVLETLSGLSNPSSAGTFSYTSSGLVLDANSTYAIVVSVSAPSYGSFNVHRTVSNGDTGSAGWSVYDTGYQYYDGEWHADPAKVVSSVTASAVPEPSTWAAIVGACALGATVLMRRQRRCA